MNKNGSEDRKLKILICILLGIIFIVCYTFLLLLYNSIDKYFNCIGDILYTYIDLDNNKGKAIDCDKNLQPYLICELEDNRIIQVKEYKREVENLCD